MAEPTLKDILWDSIVNNWTPDAPELRYNGSIPVLLNGELAETNVFRNLAERNKLALYNDWTTISFRAFTSDKYCAFKNRGGLLDEVQVPDFVFPYYDDIVLKGGLTPRPIRGKLISCSLKTLMLLDSKFYNSVIYDRVKVKIENSPSGVDSAWMYIIRKDRLFEEKGDGKFRLKKGVTMRPYLVERVGERSAYF